MENLKQYCSNEPRAALLCSIRYCDLIYVYLCQFIDFCVNLKD